MDWFIYVLRNTFNYQGRAKRAEFIWFIAVYELSSWFLLLMTKVTFALRLPQLSYSINALNDILDLLFLLPMLSVTIRRLHDLGYSGWWQMPLMMINMLGLILIYLPHDLSSIILNHSVARMGMFLCLIIYICQICYLMTKKGQPFINRYGKPYTEINHNK
ncbi:DUF805 domain-containing protein [Actinobacillus genomosp. 2]|uniref:DUF805 domain-containing protein n=1 Tax=Actinobacillus genomosp. 2 TaxID=230709 RepID=UPI002442A605|nr:DUF805 domain-containing protein [Actinobacillus genomosp. 2]WGE31308.1 DUF805 domain-containing protein [Actinobacillus genomosp. 2]